MRSRVARRGGALGLVAVAALVTGVGPAAATTGGASAYGATVDVTPPGQNAVHAGPFAATSTTAGPTDSRRPASATVPGVLTTGVINTGAHRNADTGVVGASASAATVRFPLLRALGRVGADAVEATCDATQRGIGLSATLVNASLGSLGGLATHPEPNTVVPAVGGVATVVLDEQLDNPDGSRTVNAIHIRLLGAGSVGAGDVIISSATCGPAALSIPLASGAGGWLGIGLLGAAAGVAFRRRRRTAITSLGRIRRISNS